MVAGAALAWTFLAPGEPAPARVTHPVSGIAFVTDVPWTGQPDVFVLSAGLGLRDVTRSPGSEFWVTWAADGSRVAFVRHAFSGGRETEAILLANGDGTAARLVRTCEEICAEYELALSPDGSRLAYVRDSAVRVLDLSSDDEWVICGELRCGEGLGDIAWSPDGARLAYSNRRVGLVHRFGPSVPGSVVWIAAADGSGVPQPTQPGCLPGDPPPGTCSYADVSPAWSPDGRALAFSRAPAGAIADTSWIMVVDPAEGAARILRRCPGSRCSAPLWSPDGKRVSTIVHDIGAPTIHLFEARGSATEAVRVCSGPICPEVLQMAWAPDGSHVALILLNGRTTPLFTMRIDGTDLRRVAESAVHYEEMIWLGEAGKPTPVPPPWRPPAPPPLKAPLLPGLIAFENGAGGHHIEVMRSDGSRRHRFTKNYSFSPGWSPDGSHLAFAGYRSWLPNTEVFTVDAGGRHGRPLTRFREPGALQPAWSPDGRRIAFIHQRRGQERESVWVMNADGTDPHPIGPAIGASDPAWSPDGSMIAFSIDRGTERLIYVMRPDGSDPRQLATPPGVSGPPTWWPDGRSIAFSWGVPPEGGLFAAAPDGSGFRKLPNLSIVAGNFSFSPDGSRIVFVSRGRPGLAGLGIYTMKLDGTGLARLYSCRRDCSNPVWQPVG
jgi:TolB protein